MSDTTSTTPNHPGWGLSRYCICDTLLAKREGTHKGGGLIRSLYCANIRALRETQLAPYAERWREGRFLAMQLKKRAAPEIVIVVRGGMVEEVRSTNPFTKIYIADYDTDVCEGDHFDELDTAEERGNAPDMHVVL